MTDTVPLPPLPENDHAFVDMEGEQPDILVWNEKSMQAYARAAIASALALVSDEGRASVPQEPVAWLATLTGATTSDPVTGKLWMSGVRGDTIRPLYATPVQPQPAPEAEPSDQEADWLDTAYERLCLSCKGAGEIPPTLPTFVRGLIGMLAPVMGAAPEVDGQMALDARAIAALRELVAVKDLKEQAEAQQFAGLAGSAGENWKEEYTTKRKDYTRRQPIAWDTARAVIRDADAAMNESPQAPRPEGSADGERA